MRAVVQRVSRASVVVDAATVGAIDKGIVVLAGIHATDTDRELQWMADKVVNLRIFEDDAGKMNLSVLDVQGGILIVPNFTVAGDARKGRRPSFDSAMPPAQAEPMFAKFRDLVAAAAGPSLHVASGVFRATMAVQLVNDGPVTIVVET
jgi:D-tyrosyl-tRNA(Tyr) deacylase